MAFIHGTKSRLVMNARHLSCEVRSFSTSWSANLAEVTALCDGGSKFIPGMSEGGISLEGLFQSDQGGTGTDYIHETIMSALTDTVDSGQPGDNTALITAAPAGWTAGYPAFIQRGELNSYEVESTVDDAVSLKMEAQSDDSADWGVVVATATALDENSDGDSTSISDVASATSNGGAAILHTTALSDSSATLDIKLQHSADDTTYADLVTFAQATDPGAQFKVVAKGTTVNKHLRVNSTVSTGDTADFVVAFARR